MLRQRLQLALVHVAITITLVPIRSTLNRVMINDLLIPATVFALLAALPYAFSPIQVAIGSFSDRHPLLGLRRTPYIVIGLGLCVLGVMLAPRAAFLFEQSWWVGFFACLLVFGAWGMGFNFSTVSYFSLASELSGEKGRSRTISVMFVLMVVGIILTSYALSRMLVDYSPEALIRAFDVVGVAALALGLIGLLRLEPRAAGSAVTAGRESWGQLARVVSLNPQTRLFFIYLVLLLAAILGQDNLLEPFAARAFNLSVEATTSLTRIMSTGTLICLILAAWLERRMNKRRIVIIGSVGAAAGLLIIVAGGLIANKSIFYAGVTLLGLAIGLATVSNLSLMLDMTRAGQVGLFIGAWGMADAFARLVGDLLGGVVRDFVTLLTRSGVAGYLVVFGLEAVLLMISLIVLRRIDVGRFQAQGPEPSVIERVAIAGGL